MIRSLKVAICSFVALFLSAAHVSAQFYSHTTDIRGTLLWVPPELQTVKGIVVWGNGAGADERSAAWAPWLQNFARVHGFALIGTSMWGNLAGTEINTWDTHINALATQSGHPEL